jgi:pyruvate kinase
VKKDIITKIRTFAKENNQYIPILLNLSFYRVYIESINNEEEANIIQNGSIYISDTSIDCQITIFTEPRLNYKNLTKGDIIHANYGEVSFKVEEVQDQFVKCIALNSGVLQRYNSISFEAKEHFSNDLIVTDKNKLMNEIQSAVMQGVEFVVMSVIDNPVAEIR